MLPDVSEESPSLSSLVQVNNELFGKNILCRLYGNLCEILVNQSYGEREKNRVGRARTNHRIHSSTMKMQAKFLLKVGKHIYHTA